MLLDKLWYNKTGWRWLLWPLSLFYVAGFCLHRSYIKAFKKEEYSVPIIVVGNLTVGGTGKTPLVITLATHFKALGIKVGIVSRGYGALTSVYPHEVNAKDDAYIAGDEPLLIHLRTNCPVVIAPKRTQAVRYLIEKYQPDVIISDDGLQHHAMGRAVEIVVINSERKFGNEMLLPAGPLREGKKRLNKVDFVVFNQSATLPQARESYNQGSFPLGGGSYNQGSFPLGGGSYNQGSFPLGGGGYNQGSFPLGGGSYNQGSFPLGGGSYNQGSFPLGRGSYNQGSFPLGRGSYNQGSFPLGGGSYNQGSPLPLAGEGLGVRVFNANLHLGKLRYLKSGKPVKISDLHLPIAAFAGIANPDRFFDSLVEMGLTIKPYSFPDHYRFVLDDLQIAEKTVVMTEKDAVKCLSFPDPRIVVLPIEAHLDDGFWQALSQHPRLVSVFNKKNKQR